MEHLDGASEKLLYRERIRRMQKRSLYRKRIRRVQERKRYREDVRNNIEKYKVKQGVRILAPCVYQIMQEENVNGSFFVLQ